MPFLVLILTFPLIGLAHSDKQQSEKLYFAKLSAIWLLCQMYVLVNNTIRFPLGLIAAFAISQTTKCNKRSKFIAVLIGIASFLISYFVYQLYS